MGMVGPNGTNSEYLNGLQTEEATKYSNNNIVKHNHIKY